MLQELLNYQGVCLGKKGVEPQIPADFLTDTSFCTEFEQALRRLLGLDRTIHLVSSPHVALSAALRMLHLRSGESIFVPAYWRRDYVDCLLSLQLRPIFVEVTSFNMAMDPLLLSKHLEHMASEGSPLPRAIIVAHAHGIPANMDLLCEVAQRYNMTLIEDCSQALGSYIDERPCGAWGQLSFFSFSAGEIIQAGMAGAISWSDNRSLSQTAPYYTWSAQEKLAIEEWLRPYPLAPLQAVVLISQIGVLKDIIEKKHIIAKLYAKCLSQIVGLRSLGWQDTSEHSYHPNYSSQPVHIEPTMLHFSRYELLQVLEGEHFVPLIPSLEAVHGLPGLRAYTSLESGIACRMSPDLLYLPNDSSLTGARTLDVVEEIRKLVLKYNS
jgi:Predicted pyridoxal phosphate-dependent enzyme apparently involved in regulation of cell wall biogenesis